MPAPSVQRSQAWSRLGGGPWSCAEQSLRVTGLSSCPLLVTVAGNPLGTSAVMAGLLPGVSGWGQMWTLPFWEEGILGFHGGLQRASHWPSTQATILATCKALWAGLSARVFLPHQVEDILSLFDSSDLPPTLRCPSLGGPPCSH